MIRDYPQMKLRMSPELRKTIESAAKESGRSMNAEIIHRLDQSFAIEKQFSGEGFEAYKGAEKLIKKEFERMRKETEASISKLAYELKVKPDHLDESDLD